MPAPRSRSWLQGGIRGIMGFGSCGRRKNTKTGDCADKRGSEKFTLNSDPRSSAQIRGSQVLSLAAARRYSLRIGWKSENTAP